MIKKFLAWILSFRARRREKQLLGDLGFDLGTPVRARAGFGADELLRRVGTCSERNDGWTEIWNKVNPPSFGNNFQEMFLRLRGPHLAIPHVALNLIQDAARKVLAQNPHATADEAIRRALQEADPFTRQSATT